MGYLQPHQKNSRWQQNLPEMAYRSTDQQSIFDRWQLPVDRSVDRSKQRATCSQSVDRAVDRLMGKPACTYPCTSVDRYGRLATWSGRPSGRPTQPGSSSSDQKNIGFYYPINSHKTSKNPQKQFSHYSLKYKLVLKFSTQISTILNHFCVMEKLPKTKIVFFQTWIFQMKICFVQNLSKYKNMIFKHFEACCIWIEIQYT